MKPKSQKPNPPPEQAPLPAEKPRKQRSCLLTLIGMTDEMSACWLPRGEGAFYPVGVCLNFN